MILWIIKTGIYQLVIIFNFVFGLVDNKGEVEYTNKYQEMKYSQEIKTDRKRGG